MTAAFAGFALGLSLILAIGAQNAFVLRQGIRGAHVLPVVLTCAISDAILVSAGVAGFGVLVSHLPWLEWVMRLFGAAFLTWYGVTRLISAHKGGQSLAPDAANGESLKGALLTCLAFTWLNPHVYLDTVVLLGSVSTRYAEHAFLFGAGAVTASFVFFFTLGYGARLLRPLFARPRSWQVLDAGIAVTMFAIAARLLLG
jgi:L-lysine exporter family protein LysE/ArgO